MEDSAEGVGARREDYGSRLRATTLDSRLHAVLRLHLWGLTAGRVCRAHQWSNVYPTHFTRSSKPCSGLRHKNNFMGFSIKAMFSPLVLCHMKGDGCHTFTTYFCHHACLTMGHRNCVFLFTFSRNWHTVYKIYEIIFNRLIYFELKLNWLILNQVIPCFCSFRLD